MFAVTMFTQLIQQDIFTEVYDLVIDKAAIVL
jgi:hypothetical protein